MTTSDHRDCVDPDCRRCWPPGSNDPRPASYRRCDSCDAAIAATDAPVECAACRPPDMLADVLEFHQRFGLAYDGPSRALPESLREFRSGLLLEEGREYETASRELATLLAQGRGGDPLVRELLAEQLDALVDSVYVALGNAVMQGFVTGRGAREIFAEAWRRVHAANMRKERATADGSNSARGNSADVVKPPGWRAPSHEDLVEGHAHRETPP